MQHYYWDGGDDTGWDQEDKVLAVAGDGEEEPAWQVAEGGPYRGHRKLQRIVDCGNSRVVPAALEPDCTHIVGQTVEGIRLDLEGGMLRYEDRNLYG